jgi:tRNA A-37 threonylcarbamoyl transferase component Bud32
MGRSGLQALRVGGMAAIGKRARHGGAARFLGGLYLGRQRAVRPLVCALRLRESGVFTPSVLAAGWRRVLGPLHAHALITELIPGGVNLQAAMGSGTGATERRVVLTAAGAAVRKMHDAGFLHADLNLANLVLERTSDGLRAHIIDLDRGRFEETLTSAQRRATLERLLRSWEKWRPGGKPLGLRDALAFLRGYSVGDKIARHELFHELRRFRARLGPRRVLWRWSGRPGGGNSAGDP